MSMRKTNWYVLTGAPSSGKTTIIQLLEEKGYHVVYEAARAYIDDEIKKGKTIDQIRKNESAFHQKVFELKIKNEKELDPKEVVFLDRALPDTIAYNAFLNMPIDSYLEQLVSKIHYKKVFLFEKLEYKKDYARTESREEVLKLEKYLEEVYKKLRLPIIKVPAMSIEKRLYFILNNL